ncbi:unnamed protein product [Mytilus coruscus]|uniref:BTB domain-containing protein n=1 Tax=Mytilus coruscus TaxID=42192 RepID=A0A6J8AXD5_MYTCO|nr:unnamed protein product [Mytilus coruscus]
MSEIKEERLIDQQTQDVPVYLSPSVNDDVQEFSTEEETETEDFQNLESVFAEQNLTIRIKKAKLHVIREQLTRESPVFERMLQSEFQEKDAKEITLPGKRVEDFVYFLRCTLVSTDDDLTDVTVHKVLPLAHEYQTKRTLEKADLFLKEKCETESDDLSSQQIIENILEAELYNLPQYLNACINIASRKYYQKLVQNDQFENISIETRLKISLKRWEDIDTMFEKTNFFKSKVHNKSQFPWNIELSFENVGESLKSFMHNN